MNYRHAFHAGNFADVHKHIALVAILLHLRKKETPFAVIETHAGRGCYDLNADEAIRTGEAAGGIGRLLEKSAEGAALGKYLEIVKAAGPQHYPGSPLIAATLLRPQDRLVAVEQEMDEHTALRGALRPYANARTVAGDGYAQPRALLPPPERRGVILIDPPYEAADEMRRITALLADAYRRFEKGIYLIWHPLKDGSAADAWAGEIRALGVGKLLSLTLDVGRAGAAPIGQLSASGLLVINPPHGLDAEMQAAAAEILPLLQRGSDASANVRCLAGTP